MGKDVTTLKIKFETDSKAVIEATGETKELDEAISEVSESAIEPTHILKDCRG